MTRYIAIDGRGGSGKTYLSEVLGKKLNAPVIHLDKYGSDFAPFVGIPVFAEVIKETKGTVVIFEGVGAFDSRLEHFNALHILAEPPKKVRRERLKRRDIPRADRTIADWKKIDKIWSKAEKKYFSKAHRRKADIIVDTLETESDISKIVRLFG